MNFDVPGTNGDDLQARKAYSRLVELLRVGTLESGQFLSMPALVEVVGFPLASTREAVKRAEVRRLVEVLPKRGVMVMRADAEMTRACIGLRAILDQEGARQLIARGLDRKSMNRLRSAHEELLAAALRELTPELPARALETDLSLHDALATGLDNPLAAEVYAINRDRIAVIQNTRAFLPDRIVSAMQEHLRILDALEAEDPEGTAAAIREHCAATLRWWGVPA